MRSDTSEIEKTSILDTGLDTENAIETNTEAITSDIDKGKQ